MAVALISGCSSGFGLLSALHFARMGESVVAGVRDPARAGELVRARDREGLAIEIVGLDVTDGPSVASAAARVLEVHGRIDVLVNNAGVGLWGAIEDTDPAMAAAVFETNLLGPLRLLRAVLPSMRAQGAGVVVNVTSLAGRVSRPFGGLYSATKFALEAVSEALHYEVGPFGVRVAIIEPGNFSTGFGERRLVADPRDASPYAGARQRWELAMARLPGRDRPGDPQAVATAVYEAATRPDHPLRRLVGGDAEIIAGLRHDLDDAGFEQTVRSALDFWE